MGKRALAVVMAAWVLAAAGCGRGREKVLARVNRRPITQRQLWRALEQADNGEAGRRALDALIVRRLVRQEAEKKGIELDQAEVDERLEGLKDYVLAGTGLDFDAWLERTGQTEDDVIGRIRLQMLTAKLVLFDKDREAYFEESKKRLEDLPHNHEAVIYRRIVLGSKEEADAVYEQLTSDEKEGGADFAEVAEARSLDPITRLRGGMVGWAVKGMSADADPELEKVLFSLTPGEISEPLQMNIPGAAGEEGEQEAEESAEAEKPTLERWQIVKVEKYVPPHEITLQGNADVIEEWMMSDQRYQARLQEFFENLRANADVEVVSPRYQALGEAYRQRREARERMRGPTPGVTAPVGPEVGREPALQEGGR